LSSKSREIKHFDILLIRKKHFVFIIAFNLAFLDGGERLASDVTKILLGESLNK
jgi:hypothetical protein